MADLNATQDPFMMAFGDPSGGMAAPAAPLDGRKFVPERDPTNVAPAVPIPGENTAQSPIRTMTGTQPPAMPQPQMPTYQQPTAPFPASQGTPFNRTSGPAKIDLPQVTPMTQQPLGPTQFGAGTGSAPVNATRTNTNAPSNLDVGALGTLVATAAIEAQKQNPNGGGNIFNTTPGAGQGSSGAGNGDGGYGGAGTGSDASNGLQSSGNISEASVGYGLKAASVMTGLPVGWLGLVPGLKAATANAINQITHDFNAAQNVATVTAQSPPGMSPAGIAAGIDSLDQSNPNTMAQTPGPEGTAATATQASTTAAQAVTDMGLSAEAAGIASQAAADAAGHGADANAAAATGIAAGVAADPGKGQDAPEAGLAAADAAAAAAESGHGFQHGFANVGWNSGDSGSETDPAGLDPGYDPGRDAGGGWGPGNDGSASGNGIGNGAGSAGGDSGGLAAGGIVLRNKLIGKNPIGKDDGYGALDSGEYVIPAHIVKKLGKTHFDNLIKKHGKK